MNNMNIFKLLFTVLVMVGLCSTAFADVPPSFVVAGSVLKNTVVVDSFGIRTTNGTFWFANKKLNFSTDTTWINKLLRTDSISVISGSDTIRIRANGITFGTTTRKLYFSPDTLGVGNAGAPTAVLVFRDATDTAYVRQKYADSTLEVSLDKGVTWWELFSYVKVDTIGDGSGIEKVKGPATFREGNNIALSVLPSNIIRISSTGGGGDNLLADVDGTGLIISDLTSPVVIRPGSRVTFSISTNDDSLTINTKLLDSTGVTTGALSTANLHDSAVTTAKIKDLNVTTIKIATGAVTTTKISTGGVTSTNILDGTIALIDMSAGSVDSTKVTTGGLNSGNLRDSSVTTAKIKDLNVTSIKIANNAVGSGQLATGAVGSLQISDGSVAAVDLAQSYLQDNRPDTMSWNGQTQGGIFTLKVTDTVNRNTNTNVPADTGAKFQIVNLSTIDSTVSQIEMKFRQTGTSVLNIIGRNLGADENRLEIWTEHLGIRAGRILMYGTGTSGDSSIIGAYGSTKLVLTGGATREIVLKDTVTILSGCLRVVAAPGSGLLKTDTLRADSATITKYLELNGTRFDNLTGFGLTRQGTSLRLDTATVKLLVDTGLANSYWSTQWPVKIKAGSNISMRKQGDTLVINATTSGTSQWDIRGNNDTSVLKGISDTLLKVQKKSNEYVILSAHNMDTLDIRATMLILGGSNSVKLSTGLILGPDTITDLTGFGIVQSTAFKIDVDTAALKPVFKPRYREVVAQRIHFRRGAPADSLYASLGVYPDSSTGIVWDVIDSSKTANKVDFIYFSIIFPDTMNVDSIHFEYITSGIDSTGAMVDSVRVYKEFSPTSGAIDSSMYNVGVKKTGNSRTPTGFGFTAKGVQPGERWTIRFRNKFTAANSCVKIAQVTAGGIPK